jgi:hypothetical protein
MMPVMPLCPSSILEISVPLRLNIKISDLSLKSTANSSESGEIMTSDGGELTVMMEKLLRLTELSLI